MSTFFKTVWLVALGILALAASSNAMPDSLSGTYTDPYSPSITMTLNEAAGGTITGTLSEPGMSLPIRARRNGGGFSGTIGTTGNSMPISATVRDRQLLVVVGTREEAESITLHRVESPTTSNSVRDSAKPAANRAAPPMATRDVVINGKRLNPQELLQLERAYRVRIDNADYWYDPVLGAWGLKGGPTLGFISPGLKLGGPLRADASGRGTAIFVNGRELHRLDVQALQQITGPILPGRYFITADGLAGYEGGPPVWNLLAMTRSRGGSGGSHTWQSRLSSGFSDGTTGAVFLPNGGIVSTGQ